MNRELKLRFMEDLRTSPPTYIIENTRNQRVRPRGRDTSNTFPELQALLRDNYSFLREVTGYRIYRRT